MKSSMTKIILAAVAVLLAGAGAVLALSNPFAKSEKVKEVNGLVSVPASAAGSSAKFYSFNDGGKEIKFFLVKAKDGGIRAAFDACDACFREKKGYQQQGDVMVCRNCNQKFAIARLGSSNSGGCNPGFLPFATDGTTVTLKGSDLRNGARFF